MSLMRMATTLTLISGNTNTSLTRMLCLRKWRLTFHHHLMNNKVNKSKKKNMNLEQLVTNANIQKSLTSL